MLDWSFNLLSINEQKVFSRLSVFAGEFTLAAGSYVGGDNSRDAIASLVDKSLVCVTVDEGAPRFRLLDTTRAYAALRLAEIEDPAVTAACHAKYYLSLFRAETGHDRLLEDCRVERFAPHIGNIQRALSWAFGEHGDRAMGLALAANAAPVLLDLHKSDECRFWCHRALELLQPGELDDRQELLLQTCLALAGGPMRDRHESTNRALKRSVECAKALSDQRFQNH
jgi:predicted ATPase